MNQIPWTFLVLFLVGFTTAPPCHALPLVSSILAWFSHSLSLTVPFSFFFFGSSFSVHSLSIGIYEYSALIFFFTTSPQVISSSLMAPPITSSQITPESLTSAQNCLWSFTPVLSMVSWTLYENLHVLQPPHIQVVPNQKHYLFFLGKSLLPPPVFPLLVDDIELGALNSSYPFPLSLISIS